MSIESLPLFDAPNPVTRPGSRTHAAASATSGRPRWAQIKTVKPLPCDECFALQHETGGASGPRAVARHRRSCGGKTLNLCSSHARMWRERDEETTTP